MTSLQPEQLIYEVLCRPKHKPVAMKVEMVKLAGGGRGKNKCDVRFGLPNCL